MKKLAYTALALGAIGLVGCGGDKDDPPVTFADAGNVQCNPVTQDGCGEDEKCATKVESAEPLLTRTACVKNGTVAVGGACEASAPGSGPDDGIDNCLAEAGKGFECISGACTEVCSTTPNTCGAGQLCQLIADVFDDIAGNTTGVCLPSCNPVAQDCAAGAAGCYLNAQQGLGACASIPTAATGTQMQDCHGPAGGGCFINGCAKGFQSFFTFTEMFGGGSPCLKFCTPVASHLDIAEGDRLPAGKEDPANGMQSCASPNVAESIIVGPDPDVNVQYQCRFANALAIGDPMTNPFPLSGLPNTLGVCLPKDIPESTDPGFGDCTKTQLAACLVILRDPDQMLPEDLTDHECEGFDFTCAPVETYAAARDANPEAFHRLLQIEGRKRRIDPRHLHTLLESFETRPIQ